MKTSSMFMTVPPHPAAELGERNGYTEDVVGGQHRFVTRDDLGRSVLGPRRHRHRPGLIRKSKRPKEVTRMIKVTPANEDPDATQPFVIEAEEVPEVVVPAEAMPAWKAWLTEQKRVWRRRIMDPEWHLAGRHLAVDVFLWAMSLSLAVIFLKGAWWVVTL